eukprot:TRINITY_DN3693_c0_g1_i1.p1 TRINITY_DN3693_c0_g1~~TRINITY_DN3693_c0_g1_i1.p1  ORF type:complete len:531 (-),score=77.91 TRINITY_DN3693_c0_g1_i1:20-1612(-)
MPTEHSFSVKKSSRAREHAGFDMDTGLKLPRKTIPSFAAQGTSPEAGYWKSFKFPVVLEHYAPITHIDFSPVAPHEFAVTSSSKVQIYDPNTNTVKRQLARFNNDGEVFGGSFRQDGRLLVAGGESGNVRVCDISSRTVLRTFSGHTQAARVTRFTPDNVHIMSGSDDKTLRCWDLASGEQLGVMTGHTDHIRCGCFVPGSSSTWVTGSYDHTVRLWDTKTQETIAVFDHEHPVEDVLVFPGGTILASAGSNEVKIWDLLTGKLVTTLNQHQKTVTSLGIDHQRSRLFSGSLDQQIKIYSTETYNLVHGIKYPGPIMSLALSPANTHLVVGMSDGILSIRHRPKEDSNTVVANNYYKQAREERIHQAKGDQVFDRLFLERGVNAKKPEGAVVVTSTHRKQKLKPYEELLKRFQYGLALDAAIKSNDSIAVLSLFEEFIYRQALDIPLSGRNELELLPVLNYLLSHITKPFFAPTLLQVFDRIIDIYLSVLNQSMKVRRILQKINDLLHREIELQEDLHSIVGLLELLGSK